jgi:tellurite resistance protein TerC
MGGCSSRRCFSCIEISDVIFAVDSIPAIFGVTTDPFLVFTSNVFAIMGLRSLYFVLSGVIDKFHYLKPALGVVLSFVGIKMLLGKTQYKISTELALIVTVSVLAVAIIASILFPKRIIPEDGTNAGTDEQR